MCLWIENKLGWYKYYGGQRELSIDSIFCVNKTGNKLKFAILKRCLDDCKGDYIAFLYGMKIQEKWYFFNGETLVLPREFYQEDIHTPLSFEKMKELAAKHIYQGYLKKNPLWKGQLDVDEYVINEKFFARFGPIAHNEEISEEQLHKEVLEAVKDNWKKRDTTN